MTNKEMAEAIQQAISLLDGSLDPNNAEPWRDVGKAQGLLGNVIAALEAEPLAVVEGWAWPDLAAWNDDGEWILDLADTREDENRIPVTITITRKPDA
jgi:hypothetical protein